MNNLINSNNEVVSETISQAEVCRDVLSQKKAHSSRSKKYSVVETGDVLQRMEAAGFTWKKVAEERNTLKYKGFGTHLICVEHPEITLGNAELDRELRPQLYIKNSYHGRSRFEMHLGLFRFFCMNGLILGDRFKTVKFKHIGLTKEEIVEIVEEMKRVYKEEVAPFILALKEVQMTPSQQNEFAEIALKERLADNPNFLHGEHERLLTCLRPTEAGNSLWEIFQRVQENLGLNFAPGMEIQYSYNATDKDGNPIVKERKIRELKNIKEVTYLNKFLFDTISEYLPEDKQIKIAA